MKINLCVLLIIFSFVLWQKELMAQTKKTREIIGTVEDEQSLPLPGVTIKIKNVNLGTATDKEGRYKLKVPINMEEFTLVFSFIGMESREIVYQGKDTINVVLREESHELEEVIVNTGYERINLRESTSAIQSIKAKDIVIPGLSSIDQMLEGHVPGLIYMQNSGQIGVSPRLSIRGTSTILGSREPVWVINGIVQESPVNIDPKMINDLDFVNLLGNAVSGLNPEDIEQIDILKDASATALYGARAANGVIVVTTKKGKIGAPSFSYSFAGTFRKRPYYFDYEVNMMNSRERVDFSRELLEKRIVYPSFSSTWLGYEGVMYKYWQGECSFNEMQREVGFYESVNTDWFKELMNNSFSHGHTFNLSGGSSVMNYYTSFGYRKENGNIKGESNDQYTISMQLVSNFGRFTFRGGVNGFVTRKEYVPEDVEVVQYAYSTTRALPLRRQDGLLWYYGKSIKDDPYLYRDYNILNEMENSSRDIQASGFTVTVNLDGEVTGWLTAMLVGSYSFNNTTDEVWHGENSFYTRQMKGVIKYNEDRSTIPFGGELQYGNTEKYAYTLRGQLNASVYLDRERLCPLTLTVGGGDECKSVLRVETSFSWLFKRAGKENDSRFSCEISLVCGMDVR